MPKISALPPDSTLNLTDYIPFVDPSIPETRRVTVADLIDILADELPVEGWNDPGVTLSVSTGYNKGNKEFDITTSASLVPTVTPGNRIKLTRGTSPSTQCTDLEASSSQYWTKASPSNISFTTVFTVEVWMKLESYSSANQYIVNRRNANTEGWSFRIDATTGQITLQGLRIASNNKGITTNQAPPLNQWVHLAGTLDMTAGDTSAQKIWVDGIEYSRTYTLNGTATALVQGTNDLRVGSLSSSATEFFDGMLSDLRVWSAARTQTQIRDNMNQALVGNETNLNFYTKFNGNATDATANGNTLTAVNSAAATSANNPMHSVEYGIVTKVTASTLTIFTGTDYNIPNMTLSSPYYSMLDTPLGFPRARTKWRVQCKNKTSWSQSSPGAGTWYNLGSHQLTVPTGEWELGYECGNVSAIHTSAVATILTTLSKANNTEDDEELSTRNVSQASSGNSYELSVKRSRPVSLSSQTTYYMNLAQILGSGSSLNINGGNYASNVLYAVSAYV